MSVSAQCPVCHTPLSAGNPPRCRECNSKPLPLAPATRMRRPAVLLLGTALVVVPVVLVCRLGMPTPSDPAGVEPALALAVAPVAPSVRAAPAVSALPAAWTPYDDLIASSPRLFAVPRLSDVPPAPASELRSVDSPPEAAKPFAPKEALPAPPTERSEDDLLAQLSSAPDFGLSLATRSALVHAYQSDWYRSTKVSGIISFDPSILLQHCPQVGRLPLRPAASCQVSPKAAATLGVLARKLHAYLDLIAPRDEATGQRTEPNRLRKTLREERRGKRPEWLRPEAVPALLQILMAEDVSLRLVLVDILADIDGKAATVALARRAVFDTSAEVRQAAVHALRDRPREHYRRVFVDALRYPWPPAADHAARALIALEDGEALPLLVALLARPDPAAPYTSPRGGTYVRHLVRVNHQASCLLCHVPAVTSADAVVGVDPFLKRPAGWGRRSSDAGKALLIRADVAFLRQDFSVSFRVGQPGLGADGLRFDFLVATRPLTRAELRAGKGKPAADPTAYPQRDAVLFALRGLTGHDAGPTTEAWLRLFPYPDAPAEGGRVGAGPDRSGG